MSIATSTTTRARYVAESHRGMTILRCEDVKASRRVLYLNSYGMATAWRDFRDGLQPGQHLWGCLELAQKGYEVAMPEEPRRTGFSYNYRRQDLNHVRFARSWLRRDDIIYSAHTILFWTPLLAQLKLLRRPIVSMLYACGENLRFPDGYTGLLALTPAAESRAKKLAPSAKVIHIGWGVDVPFFPMLPYEPKWFLSCGKTRRDFTSLTGAGATYSAPIHVINTSLPDHIKRPPNIKAFTGGSGTSWQTVSFHDLLYNHYAGCTAALIILLPDPTDRFAAGFTQLLEAMALGRPVIVTKTGALAGELDVEQAGCGLAVPPNSPDAIVAAMKYISSDPERAKTMGLAGRRLCETHYNTIRYGADLHRFFESL